MLIKTHFAIKKISHTLSIKLFLTLKTDENDLHKILFILLWILIKFIPSCFLVIRIGKLATNWINEVFSRFCPHRFICWKMIRKCLRRRRAQSGESGVPSITRRWSTVCRPTCCHRSRSGWLLSMQCPMPTVRWATGKIGNIRWVTWSLGVALMEKDYCTGIKWSHRWGNLLPCGIH